MRPPLSTALDVAFMLWTGLVIPVYAQPSEGCCARMSTLEAQVSPLEAQVSTLEAEVTWLKTELRQLKEFVLERQQAPKSPRAARPRSRGRPRTRSVRAGGDSCRRGGHS